LLGLWLLSSGGGIPARLCRFFSVVLLLPGSCLAAASRCCAAVVCAAILDFAGGFMVLFFLVFLLVLRCFWGLLGLFPACGFVLSGCLWKLDFFWLSSVLRWLYASV
jgi:hypothetical protein